VRGEVRCLDVPLHHYTFHSIEDQVLANLRYAKLGSQRLIRAGKRPRISLLLFKPVGKFLETYFLKRGFLDGLPGFIIAVNAAYSMFMKYSFLLESEISLEVEDIRSENQK
jgi:hypothetical protein